MSFALHGHRAVVTGGSRGIGQAVAIALARAGADVASIHLPDRDNEHVTRQGIADAGRRALLCEGDVADPAVVDAFARRVTGEWGGIDIWINNAARLHMQSFVESTHDEWRGLFDCNLHGYVHGCRAAARVMLSQSTGGRIVNVASITSAQPPTQMAAYSTAKGAIVTLTRALAVELAPHRVNVNAVAPGAVVTPLTAHAFHGEVRQYYEQRIPLGRLAEPDDIAGPVLFLASSAARYVNGQVLTVDGGLSVNGSVTIGGA